VSRGFKDVVFKRLKKKSGEETSYSTQPDFFQLNHNSTHIDKEIITKGALRKHINVIEVN
jgi:hypothetical protein